MIPRVSVVMGLYNGEKFLAEQIESVRAQSLADWELVLSDDASTDGTAALARSFAAKDARIRCYRHERNVGITENFLGALAAVKGEYVAFSDQDDVWAPRKLERLAGVLSARPDVSLVYSDMSVCAENLRVTAPSFFTASKIRPRRGDLSRVAILKNVPPGCSTMFRRDVCRRISAAFSDGRFRSENSAPVLDETPFMHDHLAFVTAALSGKIAYVPEPLVLYRQHDFNRIGAFYRARSGRDRFNAHLAKKISLLKNLGWAVPAEWEDFASLLSGGGSLRRRWKHVDRYRFLRNDTLRDQTLAVLECLSPAAYRSLKGGKA